ncbi:MAG: MarR family transcriptional regulator [Solirubrobacteraceae bacterium]|nr:MarR family transcriptional regulator [Solirubrobacteraceae bacterium]
MHPSMDPADAVTERLALLVHALSKGTKHEVMEIAAEFDLTLTQLRILFIIDHAQAPLAVNQIADTLGISMPATGRAIDALHRTGLVSRREDSIDRRIKRIALTDVGLGAITRIAAARIASVQALVGALTDDERAAVDAATTTLSDIVARHLPGHLQHGGASGAAAATETAPTPGTESDHE